MVLKPEPLFEAVESLLGHGVGDAARKSTRDPKTAIVLLSAGGKLFDQETARRYAQLERIIFICDGMKALMSALPSIYLRKKFRLGTSF